MKTSDLQNLFPERLRQAAMEFFAAEALGAVLLRQPEAEAPPEPSIAEFLHGRELARAKTYRFAKRRSEFLAGRVSAKLALAELWAAKGWQGMLSHVEIDSDAQGRPVISTLPGSCETAPPPCALSISHSGAYGAALAGDLPCGIDLQEQKESLLRIQARYCAAGEDLLLAASLPAMAPLARLSLLWAAKEAAKKACSSWWMPGFLDLRLELPVEPYQGWQLLSLAVTRMPEPCPLPGRLAVLATIFNQYGLAVCILSEARRHAGTAGS